MSRPRGTIEDLHADLLFMRKNRGFTPTRIADAGTLRHVLGGDQEPFERLRERFVSAINSLHDPAPDLLLAAFGLSAATAELKTLMERRKYYGALINRGTDTVAALEDAALEGLRAQLLTGWYPASPLTARLPELHNGVVQEAVNVITVIKDRRWQETREHYRFFAAFDEADYIAISTSFPGKPIPEGDFTVRTKEIGNSFTHQFWHKTPMRRGHSYDLRFTLTPDTDYGEPGVILEESRAFHERTLTASFEAIFLGAKPSIIWRVERLTHFERPGDPTRSNILTFDDGSTVRASYRDLYGGLFNGIAWQW
ncbi:hypothetical protein J2X01_001856 [Arthrobacter ginsengisoli]|uniref:Uncharacterized protein n=1 Tax=Arthrobacter ginsengisoli TaxID=1356565 RepID=A0ABU1UBI7_9MICC|nr:hypothetical protein [Arthrobacter ginsengisoli]MDR7082567.1 hypothetical protein [Arthrobacter ginsengisoli]